MNITAVIAEYNPLHLGHQFHIKQTRKETNADYIITILSGDFVQRGLPAITDKHTRTRMALEAGSDLVLELPVPYALSSGEGFAFGGVSLLHQLGCVNTLSFGSEAGSLDAITRLATVLAELDACRDASSGSNPLYHDASSDSNPLSRDAGHSAYQHLYKEALKKGLTHPSARLYALKEAYPELDTSVLDSHSNNLLALEYCKALHQLDSTIRPFTLKRQGQGYLEKNLPADTAACFASATAVREALQHGQTDKLLHHLAPETETLLSHAFARNELLFLDDFSDLLHYKLLSLSKEALLDYWEVTSDFANKLTKELIHFESFTQFSNLLWSKDITYARVCRTLMHILLNIRQDTWDVHQPVPYARILGFRKTSAPLLSCIKEHASIPLLSKLADAEKLLPPEAFALLELDIRTAHIYDSVRFHKSGLPAVHEMQKQLVIL